MLRNLTLVLFFCSSFYLQSTAQFGAPEKEVDNLIYLAKTWGYIKYFHPEVRNCQKDWDAILISTLTELNGSAQEDYHDLLEAMMDQVGIIPESNGSAPPILANEELNNLNIEWMNDNHLNASIQEKLNQTYIRSRPGNHCLYEAVFSGGNLDFNEPAYSLGTYPDVYFRLLALFRYWNVIEYFFPYKHLMDQDWDTTLSQFIMPIINAEDALGYHLEIAKFRTYINDTHGFIGSVVYARWRGLELVPYKLKFIEDRTVIVSVADNNLGIEAGDILLEVDGVGIEDLRSKIRPFMAASNPEVLESNINNFMYWGEVGSFDITVEKSNGERKVVSNLIRSYDQFRGFHYDLPAASSWKKVDAGDCGEFGYVDMELLNSAEISTMVDDLWDMPAIIFDLRNYPQGTLWDLMPELFGGPVHIADFTHPALNYAGQFGKSAAVLGWPQDNMAYNGRVIILFDEETLSQAEYTVMGLEQHPNSIKIGSTTAAADGNVSTIRLPGEITLYFTGLGVYYPDGTPTQRVGIIPDIEVKPTIAGIRAGEDELMSAALDCNLLSSTSTEEIISKSDFSIYPNPARDFFTIKSVDSAELDLMIYSAEGVLIFSQPIRTNEALDLSSLDEGFYVANWRRGNINHSEKFVKIK